MRRLTQPLAISGATVLPMHGPRLDGATVVIADGRIRSVGAPAPAGSEVIDARGAFLMPGLADMHCHVGDEGQDSMFLANGVTRVRNMWGSPFHLRLAERIERGDRPGPRIVTTTPVIDGPLPSGAGRYPGEILVTEPSEAAEQARALLDTGYGQLKVYSDLSPACLEALGGVGRERGVIVTGHCPRGLTFETAMHAGMQCFEHLVEIEAGHLSSDAPPPPSVAERYRTILRFIDLEQIRRLAGKMAAAGVWNCPTLTVWDNIVEGLLPRAADPALRYLPPEAAARWARSGIDLPSDGHATVRQHRDLLATILGILEEEGAPLLLGTDAGSRYTIQGFAVHDEIARLREAGLSLERILRMATIDAARFLGEEDAGVVREGARADLVLLDADPVVEPATLRRPRLVVSNGFAFDRSALDDALELRAKEAVTILDRPKAELGPMSTPAWFER